MIQTVPYKKEIFKLSVRRFKVLSYDANNVAARETKLIVDYNPLFNVVKALYPNINSFVFVHWQAIPKNSRQWNVYDTGSDSLFSCIRLLSFVNSECLQIEERTSNNIRPTAIVVYFNAKVNVDNQTLTITLNPHD